MLTLATFLVMEAWHATGEISQCFPSFSTWRNKPLRAVTLMLLLKAAIDTPSDSITHAGTHTPLSHPQSPIIES